MIVWHVEASTPLDVRTGTISREGIRGQSTVRWMVEEATHQLEEAWGPAVIRHIEWTVKPARTGFDRLADMHLWTLIH